MRKLLLLLFLLSVLCVPSAWAATKTVCASDCDYTPLNQAQIQACIDALTGSYDTCELQAATAGGTATIHVLSDYPENYMDIPGSLPVQPTLKARDGDTIIIDGLKTLTGFTGSGPYSVSHTPYSGSVGPHFVVWNDNPIPRTTNAQNAPDAGEWGWVSNVLYVGSNPSGYTVQVSDRAYLLNVVKENATVQNLTFQYANAALLLGTSNTTIHDCEFNYFKGSQTLMVGQNGNTSQDYMCADGTGDWTKSATLCWTDNDGCNDADDPCHCCTGYQTGNCSGQFYEFWGDDANDTMYLAETLTEGEYYVCWVDVRDGDATGATYDIVVLDDGEVTQSSTDYTSSANYVRHWFEFQAASGENQVGIRLISDEDGDDIQLNSWQCNKIQTGYDFRRLTFYQAGQNAIKFRWAVHDSLAEDIDVSWSNDWFSLTGSSNSIHGIHLYNYSNDNVLNRINVYGEDELQAGSAAIKVQGSNGNIITYGRFGPYLGDTLAISPGSYNKVYNNTFYRSSQEASHPLIVLGNGYDVDMCDDCGASLSGQSCGVMSAYNEIKNNIFYQIRTGVNGFLFTTCSGGASDPGVDDTNIIDYNQFYGVTDGTAYWFRWFEEGMSSCNNGGNGVPYSTWQSTYPLSDPGAYQTHGAWGDPLMTNPANREFWPTSSSPCKDAGYNTGYPDVLYPALNSGTVHQGLVYDMGAYQIDSQLEFYCLNNQGFAGSKTIGTSCTALANCINETTHNAETFSPGDLIGVCPEGGAFDAQIITPSSGAERQEITYKGMYNPLYGWPILDEGLKIATSYNVFGHVEVRPGIAEAATKSFEGGRFGTCNGSSTTWQAAEETSVTNWKAGNSGKFGVGIGSVGGAIGNVTPQLYWRNKSDSGTFAAVGATGEVKYTDPGDCLTDESNVTAAEAGVSSSKTYKSTDCVTCEQEDSHQATSATNLSDNEWAELQVGVSFADADKVHRDEYEFALFESSTQVGSASLATVTVTDNCICPVGTHKTCWTGEHNSGKDYTCIDNDTSTAQVDCWDDVPATCDNIFGPAALSGSYGAVIEAAQNSYLTWYVSSGDRVADETGTLCFDILFGSMNSGDDLISEVWKNGDNWIRIRLDDVGGYHYPEIQYETGGEFSGRNFQHTTAVSLSKVELCFAWDASQTDGSDKLGIAVNGSWEQITNLDLDDGFAYSYDPARLTIGERDSSHTRTNPFNIDNIYVTGTYDAP